MAESSKTGASYLKEVKAEDSLEAAHRHGTDGLFGAL